MTAPATRSLRSARPFAVFDRRVAAGEAGADAPLEILAERRMELAELLDRGTNPTRDGDPHPIHVGRCPARPATEASGSAQLVPELLHLDAGGRGSSRIVAALRVLELRAQLGK